jgi:hypothetical protein
MAAYAGAVPPDAQPPEGELADPGALLGGWRMDRTIEDRLGADDGHVEGRLDLHLEPDGRIRWEETGTWHRSAGEVAVRRGLWVVPTEDGWWVRFEDGRDFHPWRPGRTVVHDCAPDLYRGSVTGDLTAWSVRWEVHGPRKDYAMLTRLSRW